MTNPENSTNHKVGIIMDRNWSRDGSRESSRDSQDQN